MIEKIVEVALSTLVICCVVTAFAYFTARFWSWFLKLDMLLFWMSAISKKLDKRSVENVNRTAKTKWKEVYEELLGDRRDN